MKALLPVLLYLLSSIFINLKLSEKIIFLGPTLTRAVRRLLWIIITFLATIVFGIITIVTQFFHYKPPELFIADFYETHPAIVTLILIVLLFVLGRALFAEDGSFIDRFIDFVEKLIKPANVGHPTPTTLIKLPKKVSKYNPPQQIIVHSKETFLTLLVPSTALSFKLLFIFFVVSLENDLLTFIVLVGIYYSLFFLSFRYELTTFQRAGIWLLGALLFPLAAQSFFAQEFWSTLQPDINTVSAIAAAAVVALAFGNLSIRSRAHDSAICLYWVGLIDALLYFLVGFFKFFQSNLSGLSIEETAYLFWGLFVATGGVALFIIRRKIVTVWEFSVYILGIMLGIYELAHYLPQIFNSSTG